MTRQVDRLIRAAILVGVCLIAIALAGCGPSRGAATLNEAASRFAIAAAAGDVTEANRVSRADFTSAQLSAWRTDVFGSDASQIISDPRFVTASSGSDPATYFVLDSYAQDGIEKIAGGTMLNQVGLQKYGGRWFVVSCTGPVGRFP